MGKQDFVILILDNRCALYKNNNLLLEDDIKNSEGFYICLYALEQNVSKIVLENKDTKEMIMEQGFPQKLNSLEIKDSK